MKETIGEFEKIISDSIANQIHQNAPKKNKKSKTIESKFLTQTENDILTYMGIDVDSDSPSQREELIKNLATQASYLILNKCFCYSVIRVQYKKQFDIEIPVLYSQDIPKSLYYQMREAFDYLVINYNFAPIFQSDNFFSQLTFSQNLEITICEFLEKLVELNFENLDDNFIADTYQALLPLEKKKELGQIYTPYEIAKIIVQLSIRKPNDIVLDPACGCGTFLREIYFQLAILNKKKLQNSHSLLDSVLQPDLHSKLIKQIWGVEINFFPAQLSMMTLTFLNLHSFSDFAGVFVHDFLDMDPKINYSIKTKNLQTGDTHTREMPKIFDVIIANPPYIKQEKIPKKELMLKNLPIYAKDRINQNKPDSAMDLSNVKLDLTGKTDYYGFFLWYSTYFLKNEGILCFIIPNKWMDVKYGEELKQFILKNYQIISIIGFNKNVFIDAQVSTIILLLQKESDANQRSKNITRFILITSEEGKNGIDSLVYGPLSTDLLAKIESDEYLFENPSPDVQCTFVKQESLQYEEKWSFKYLYQSELERLLSKQQLVPLDNQKISEVIGGIKTGANEFFFPSKEDLANYEIEPVLLKPGIKSGRDIPYSIILTEAPNSFLSINANLEIKQYPHLAAYIENGVSKAKYPERPSMKWHPWYSIPLEMQDCPDILFLRHIDSDFRAHINKPKCIVADGIRGVNIKNPEHLLFYLGVLNSTFFYWQAHIRGRWEGQGDLQLLVYELNQFLIPDINKVSRKKIQAVESIIQDRINQEEKIISSLENKAFNDKNKHKLLKWSREDKQMLDLAVLDCMEMKHAYPLLQDEIKFLETLRLQKRI